MTHSRHTLTILAVDDLDKAVRFYDEAFGWPLAVRVPVFAQYALPSGMSLALYERHGFGVNTGQVPEVIAAGGLAPTELYFESEDPAAAAARLHEAGARQLSALAPRPWGDEVAYFADPWGNVLAVARSLPDPSIEEVEAGRGALCREILEALPAWFGRPEASETYIRNSEGQPMFAVTENSVRVGFVSLMMHGETSAEIYVMGVKPERHRLGLGRKLVVASERFARAQGARFLTVKTVGRSCDHAGYARTRSFYLSVGFGVLEEFPMLWDAATPCLFLAKAL